MLRKRSWMIAPFVTLALWSVAPAQTAIENSSFGGATGIQSIDFADMAPSFWRLGATLCAVLLLVWGTIWVARRLLKGQGIKGGKTSMHVIERVHLAPHRTVEFVSVGDRILVLGVTEHHISILTEMTPEEMPVNKDPTVGQADARPRPTDLWQSIRRALTGGLRSVRRRGLDDHRTVGATLDV